MQKNNFIDKLDAFLLSKKNSEVMLISLLTFVVIVFAIYYFVFPVSENFLSKYQREYTTTRNSVIKYSSDINSYKSQIPNLQRDIQTAKNELEITKYTNGYVDTKLKELSYLLFNDKSWASFMDRITFLAKKHNIAIKKISNDFLDEKDQVREKVEQVLNVNVEFNSDFKNLIKFINEIEESQLVVDVSKIDLTSARKIDGNVSISVWGMLY